MLMKRLLCGLLFVSGLLLAAGSSMARSTEISTVTHDEKANRQRWKLMDKLVAFLALSKLSSVTTSSGPCDGCGNAISRCVASGQVDETGLSARARAARMRTVECR